MKHIKKVSKIVSIVFLFTVCFFISIFISFSNAKAIVIGDFGFSEVISDSLPGSASGYACAWCSLDYNYSCPAGYGRTSCTRLGYGTNNCCGGCAVISTTCTLCVPTCPGSCGDVGQSGGCTGTCPDNTGIACDDGDACTSGDTCSGGSCSGSAITCDDSNVCTNDSCSAATGCIFSNNTSSCDDGNACTSGDTCSGGSCSGSAITCDDSNACTTDSCNTASGCVYLVIPPDCVLSAAPSSIDIGDSSTLSWTTNCADTASIDNGVGLVVPTAGGNLNVFPIAPTTYTMTATGALVSDTCQDTVVSVCGDGSRDAPEACDVFGNVGCGGATPDCVAGCGSCQPVCGDGLVGGTEFCDTLNNIGCTGLNSICNSCAFCSSCDFSDKPTFLGKPVKCIVNDIIMWVLSIMGRISLLVLIFGGVLYVVSGSNPERQEKAKKVVTYALLGLIFILLSYAFLGLLEKIFVQT